MSCRRRRATVEVESRREVEMSEMRVLKRVVVLLAAWTSLVLGVSTALDDGASTPAQEPPAAVSGSSEPGTARPMPSAPPKPATTASAAQQSTSAADHDTLQQDRKSPRLNSSH